MQTLRRGRPYQLQLPTEAAQGATHEVYENGRSRYKKMDSGSGGVDRSKPGAMGLLSLREIPTHVKRDDVRPHPVAQSAAGPTIRINQPSAMLPALQYAKGQFEFRRI